MSVDDTPPPPTENDAPPEDNIRPLIPRAQRPTTRVPPHDLASEASLLGAMLLSATAIAEAVEAGVAGNDFYKPAHGHIYEAAIDLNKRGEPADPVTVADELHRDGLLEQIGGPPILVALQSGTPAISNAARYAKSVKDHARMRTMIGVAGEIAELGYSLPDDVDQAEAKVLQLVTDAARPSQTVVRERLVDGATFLLDQPDTITSVWGSGETVLWAEGEPTMIVGPSGIGKTTVCQQVILGRIGLRPSVLGQPVAQGSERALYIACDRPRQAARSMQRMVDDGDRDDLADRLMFWKGPPPFNVVEDPGALARFARNNSADTVVIDSLKDICHKLNDDEHASKTNAAIQEAIAQGVEVIVLHHQRKQAAGNKKNEAPKTLDEVYGNIWLVAGMGSVMCIWGAAGDPIVELTHLKPPAEQVGPWTLRMDFDLGYTELDEVIDPLKLVLSAARGASVNMIARAVFKTDEPDRNQLEKARYKLDKLERQCLIISRETPSEAGGKPTKLYFPIDRNRAE